MPGFFSMLTKASSYAGRATRATGRGISDAWNWGAGKFGGLQMAAATGAVGGGIYGATIGRDPGQSRLGGAFTGALGGAAMGMGLQRYGGAALNAKGAQMAMRAALKTGFNAKLNARQAKFGFKAAAGAAYSQLQRDALWAKSRIGPSLRSNAGNAWSAIKSGWKGV